MPPNVLLLKCSWRLIEDYLKTAWRTEPEWWRLSALNSVVLDRQTHTHKVTPWAPIGAKNDQSYKGSSFRATLRITHKFWNSIVMILTYKILFQFSKSPFIWTIKLKLNNFLNKSGKYFRSCLRLPEKEGFVLSSQKPEPSCQITKAHWSQ